MYATAPRPRSRRRSLGDVPTVDVNAGYLAPPPVSSVSVMSQTPNVFLVPRPQAAALSGSGFGFTFTPTTIALLAGGAAALLLLLRRR